MRSLLSTCAQRPFTYEAVGATRTDDPPSGFNVDRWGTDLGHGEATWKRAKQAVRDFSMYPPAWTEVFRQGPDIAVDLVFVTAIFHLGIWSLNPCRIIYTVDEDGETARFGFALGTIEGHVETGEERFVVSFDRKLDSVRYDVLGFSRPIHPLAKLGAPFARMYQKRFHRDSIANMRRAIAE
jgi:uncharacterized protein (UPF0548 family)